MVRLLAKSLDEGVVQPEQLSELGTLLRNHVRLEEDTVFPLIEKAVPDRMEELGFRARA